ncbi:MAG TPA: Mrp/NBP35 family ATP-binding protein [Chitinophagaceae bacterium]|nr:Mrp/NBP35 family ATP-binding protein [Chitinophagaceae bacterium]
MVTEQQVLEALSRVQEPDLKRDLVSLGMVRDIRIGEHELSFTVVLTTPACPLKELIRNNCIQAIHAALGDTLTVRVSLVSKVNSARQGAATVLPGVKNIIAVASGKGGVGKSTVAANLAIALAQDGAATGLMDADIYGPSVPLLFGVRGQRPMMTQAGGKPRIIPLERFGIRLLSIGLMVDENQAVVWRGPMASSALRQFVTDVDWGVLDYLIIDLPPGTGDIHLTLVQTVPVTGAVIVTTPQPVALADARKGIAMFSTGAIRVPVLGLVENMAYFSPPEFPDQRYYLFGKDGGKQLAEELEIPLLGQIPLIQGIREGGDHGIPAMMGDDPVSKRAFKDFAGKVAQQVAIRNSRIAPTQVVEIAR